MMFRRSLSFIACSISAPYKTRLSSDPRLEFAPIAELKPTVKGDGFACRLGQGFHHTHQAVHQMRCAAVIVAEQDGKAGFALDQ